MTEKTQAPQPAQQWTVSVAGPDDVHRFDTELDALRFANQVNRTYLADLLAHPGDEVLCLATVTDASPPLVAPAEAEPISKQYLREQVARQMKNVHHALAETQAPDPAPARFPAGIWALLLDVADRNGKPGLGPWQNGDGETMQDDADAAIAWIKAAAIPAPEGAQELPPVIECPNCGSALHRADLAAPRVAEGAHRVTPAGFTPEDWTRRVLRHALEAIEAGASASIVMNVEGLKENIRALLSAPAPQAPVALTLEQIIDATVQIDVTQPAWVVKLARAIERAHGIPAPHTKEPKA